MNLERAKALAAGEPLERLPKEAFDTRSAKGRSAPADPEASDPAALARAKAQRPRRAPKPTPPAAD